MQGHPRKLKIGAGWVSLLAISILLLSSAAHRSAALPLSEAETLATVDKRPPSLPDPPTLLAPADSSSTCSARPDFRWSRVKKATWYHIQVDDGSAFESPEIDQTTEDTSFTPAGDLTSGTYHWRVRASNADVTGTWSAAWGVTIVSLPAESTLLSPPDGSRSCDRRPTLEWSTVDDATSFRIQLDDDPSFDSPELDTSTSNSEYTVETELAPGTHHWRVQSVNVCGGSPWSAVFTLTILSTPSTPALLAPDEGSSTYDRTPTFAWQSTEEANSYRIQIDEDQGFDSPLIDQTTGSTFFTPVNALSNGTYHWRVLAFSTCGSGDWSDPWSVTISNQAPIANDDRLTVDEDSSDNLLDVLANDVDVNEDPLGIIAVTQPAHGSVTIADSGTRLRYRPDPDYFGQDSLSYTVDDGNGGMGTARVAVTITAINDPPIARDDTSSTDEDTPVTIDVLANDSDVDGQLAPSTVQSISGPNYGSTRVDPTSGTITYYPALNWSGRDRLSYRVCDDGTPLPAQCDTAAVEVTVRAVNDPPIANAGPDQRVKTSTLVTLDGSQSYDPDGDRALRYFWTQSDGPTVTLSRADVPSPTFISPREPCTLTFKLFVIDSLDEPVLAPDQVVVTVYEAPVFHAYVPLSVRSYTVAPDLLVESLWATSDEVRLVIVNRGNSPVSTEFFVDVYIDPRSAPTAVNQTWEQLGDQGLVWAITQDVLFDLVPGGSLALEVNDALYVGDLSSFSGRLALGTTLYAQVDSYNLDTTYGNVLETHEMTGGAYNNIRGPVYSTATVSGDPADVVEGVDGWKPISPVRTVP